MLLGTSSEAVHSTGRFEADPCRVHRFGTLVRSPGWGPARKAHTGTSLPGERPEGGTASKGRAARVGVGGRTAKEPQQPACRCVRSVPLAPGARMGPGRNGGTQPNGRPRSRGASSGRKSTAGPVQSSAHQHRHTHQRSVWDFGFHFCREWSAVASRLQLLLGELAFFAEILLRNEGRCLSSRTSLSRRDRVLGRSAALRLRHGRRFSRLLANGGAARG